MAASFAFAFPGQGSQSVGMMQTFAALPVVRNAFAEASEALQQDLWAMVENGPAETLSATVNTQPVMLTADVAIFRLWRERGGVLPLAMAGHSLGEYAALVAGDALLLGQAVALVRERAQAMQAAVPEGQGAIAAILGLDDAGIVAACAEAAQNETVQPANFNAPGQVVIAGHTAAVQRAMDAAKAKGAKRAVVLPMSIPAHCLLMKPAALQFAPRLSATALKLPQPRVLQNATLRYAQNEAQLKQALIDQIYNPVRWADTVKAFAAEGVTHVVECGPGKVLTALTKRIDERVGGISLHDLGALEAALVQLQS
jgi:[acyl-carrier-protein] S-malonyltransferase